jgi:hypothetical protein
MDGFLRNTRSRGKLREQANRQPSLIRIRPQSVARAVLWITSNCELAD